MRRRTFDRLVSTEGLVLAPVLAVAGGLLTWAQRYITNEVRNQLAAQKIYFPEADSPELAAAEFEAVRQYAGQQLTTGDQAKVYADHFIANHLRAMGGGKTYAELSGEALARPDDPELAAAAQLMFRGRALAGHVHPGLLPRQQGHSRRGAGLDGLETPPHPVPATSRWRIVRSAFENREWPE